MKKVAKILSAIAAAAIALPSANAEQVTIKSPVPIVRDAVVKTKEESKTVPARKAYKVGPNYRHRMTPKQNQRQKRKYWAQNPHKRPQKHKL